MANKKITVAFVDDDEYLVEMYEKKLTLADFKVLTAKDGKEGLKKILASNPDLIILDLVMPNLDGFELFKRIKAANIKGIPIIAFTNLNSEGDKHEALRIGFSDYWIKSNYTPAQFIDKIKQLLKQE